QQLMQQQLLQQRQNLSQGQNQPLTLTQQTSPQQQYQQGLVYQQQQALAYQQQYLQALQAQLAQQTNAALQQAAGYSDPTVRWAATQEIARRQSQSGSN